MSTVYAVPPVERALKLLRHIAAGDQVTKMSETARALGLSRTTLIRLIATLEAERMIERKADGSGYTLGLGLVGLAGQALLASDIVQAGDPVLVQLSAEVGLSAHIGVLEGTDVLYVARRTPNAHLVSNVGIGSRLPAHATTMGRILLAHLSLDKVRHRFAGVALQRFTDMTPTTLPSLLAQCAADRAAGLAWSDAYFEPGIASVAAVIFDRQGDVAGAVNVTGPSHAFTTREGRRDEIGRAVLAAASAISSRLGHLPGDPSAIRRTA